MMDTGNNFVVDNMEDVRNIKEELKEMRRILDLQSEEINLIKSVHQLELQNRDIEIVKLKTRLNALEKDVLVSKIKMEHCEMNSDRNEQYSRRHSVRIHGIEKEKQKETPDDVMRKIYEEMDYLDAPIKEIEIDRAHRTGTKFQDDTGKWQQPALLKFTSWKARNKFYKLRKYSNFHITADLTTRNEQILNYAREQIRQEGTVANKLINYVYADANCSLMAFTNTGRFQKFNSEAEFDAIVLHVDNTSKISNNIYDIIGEQLQSLCPGE